MRTRRSILTLVSGQFATAVTLAVGFVATPLLLRWLGDERYGAFKAALDWLGYVALLQLGLGGALRPLLAGALARGDDQQLGALMRCGIRAYLTMTAFIVAAGICLAAVITRLLPVSSGVRWDLRLGCLIGVGGGLLTPLAPFRALLEADQRGYWVNNALLGQSLLITSSALLLAWAGLGIVGQFSSLLVGSVALNSAIFYRALKQWPGLTTWRRDELRQSQAWKDIRNLNWPTFTLDICGRVGLLTDNILVGAFLSPALVVPFYITQRLATLGQRELQAIGNATWAALAELHAQGQRETFNRRLVELTRLVAILAVAGLVPILVFNHDFVALWVGPQRYGGDALTLIAVVNAFTHSIFSLWGWSICGTGQVRAVMWGLAAETGINLLLSVILTLKCGLTGPVLGTLAGFLAINCWYLPWLLYRLFGTSSRQLAMAVLLPVASGVPFGLIVQRLSNAFPAASWLAMGITMAGAASGYLALWWLLGLDSEQKRLWLQRMRISFLESSFRSVQ